MPSLRSTLALLACAIPASFLPAQTTIHIPADQPTIQAGINAANNGDTVLVSPGTYHEHIDFNGKLVTVTSSNGAASTTIDGDGVGDATVHIHNRETPAAVLSGFTITGGGLGQKLNSNGGVYIYQASPTVLNNRILGNFCQNVDIESASPTFQSNTVGGTGVSNFCAYGGILIHGPDPGGNGHATVIGNTIEHNVNGIVVNFADGTVLRNNIVRYNGLGGGIMAINTDALVIVGNLVYGNTVNSTGLPSAAGLYILAPYKTVGPFIGIIASNTFANNINANPTNYSSVVTSASDVFLDGNLAQYVFINNIVTGSTTSAPALGCATSNYLSVTPLSFDHNDIVNLAGGAAMAGACVLNQPLAGNLSADPRFANAASGDYTLLPGSPAMDAGNNSAPQSTSQDLAGNPRFADNTGKGYPVIDMGAFESASSVSSSTPLTTLQLTPSTFFSGGSSHGVPLTFTLVLSSSVGPLGGPVSFFVDGTFNQAISVPASGTITFSVAGLTPGLHAFISTYPGQGSYPPAQSVLFYLLIPGPTTALTLTGSPNPANAGAPVTFTVHASASDGTVPSPITLTDGSATLANLTPNSAGVATFTTSSLTLGTHTLTATFNGTSTYIGSSAQMTETVVSPVTTTTTVAATPNPSVVFQPLSLTATVTSSNTPPPNGSILPPAGSVVFSYNGTSIGSAVLSSSAPGSATASISYSSLPLGADVVVATYVPSGSLPASTGSVTVQVINGIATTTRVSCPSPASVQVGDTFSSIVTVTPSSGTLPAGSVDLSWSGSIHIGTANVPAGTSSFATSFGWSGQTLGSNLLQAVYTPTPGSGYAGGSGSCIVTGTAIPLSATLSATPATAPLGQTVSLDVSLTPGPNHYFNTPTPSFYGTLTITDGTTVLYSGPYLYQHPLFSTATLAPGLHTLQAFYKAAPVNDMVTDATSNTVTLLINSAPTVSTLSLSAAQSRFGTPVTAAAAVTATVGSGTPTGTVTFYAVGQQIGSAPLVNGVATLSLPQLDTAQYTLTCHYSGDSTYAPSDCSAVPLDITPLPTSLTITSSANPVIAFTPITFTIKLLLDGKPAPAGMTIAFSVGGTIVAPVTDSTGTATYTAALRANTWKTDASFSLKNYAGADVGYTEVVTANPSQLTLSAAPNPGYQGQTVNLSATLTAAGNAAPSGAIAFYDGAALLGSAPVNATGQATLSTSTLAVGTHSLTAQYAGNADFLASTSAPVTETILPSAFTLAVNPTAVTAKATQVATATVQLGTVGHFSGPVALTLGPAPAYATATLSAASVTLQPGAAGTATVTIQTMSLSSLEQRPGPRWLRSPEMWTAGLFGLLLVSRKRRRLDRLLTLGLAAALLSSATGCANDWYTRHTVAPGTYNLVVTGTAANGETHNATLSLTVTP